MFCPWFCPSVRDTTRTSTDHCAFCDVSFCEEKEAATSAPHLHRARNPEQQRAPRRRTTHGASRAIIERRQASSTQTFRPTPPSTIMGCGASQPASTAGLSNQPAAAGPSVPPAAAHEEAVHQRHAMHDAVKLRDKGTLHTGSEGMGTQLDLPSNEADQSAATVQPPGCKVELHPAAGQLNGEVHSAQVGHHLDCPLRHAIYIIVTPASVPACVCLRSCVPAIARLATRQLVAAIAACCSCVAMREKAESCSRGWRGGPGPPSRPSNASWRAGLPPTAPRRSRCAVRDVATGLRFEPTSRTLARSCGLREHLGRFHPRTCARCRSG